MTSKVSKVSDILAGAHVMGGDSLKAYHDAKACVNAMRKVGWDRRGSDIRNATKNYRVMVSVVSDEFGIRRGFRIFRPDTKAEVILEG